VRTPCRLQRWHGHSFASAKIIAIFLVVGTAALALFVPPSNAQQGAMTVTMDLARMVDESENIVLGLVTSVKSEKHPDFQNLDTVVVTLDVQDALKGAPGSTYTFRQFVIDARDRDSKLGYRVGEEVVLMIRQPSQYKLTSPVGLEQGRFQVERDGQGNRFLRNGVNNAGLFEGVAKTVPNLKSHVSSAVQQLTAQHQSGPISYEDFKSFVQGVLAARQSAQ
jgi:hypothetical protein